ncbi:MAG: hypothetical protein WAX69_05045 [Victivallales bacterium]
MRGWRLKKGVSFTLFAKLAAGTASSVEAIIYSGVPAKKVTVTLASGRKINVVGAGFVK